MAEVIRLSYCTLDGDPAILAFFKDHQIHGYQWTTTFGWRSGFDLQIVKAGRVYSEKEWRAIFPNVGMPDELKGQENKDWPDIKTLLKQE